MRKSISPEIFLFDLDGVLLHPGGYRRALQDTVSLIAKWMGYPTYILSQSDIDLFEATGVTSEWDSSAICSALLYFNAAAKYPELTYPQKPREVNPAGIHLPPPDFVSFCQALAQEPDPGYTPLERSLRILLRATNGHRPEHTRTVEAILLQAHQVQHSITMRVIQEMILGSQAFCEYYQLPPWVHVSSYLEQYDYPLLAAEDRQKLLAWISSPQHSAALFTNRQSTAPLDFFGVPEAEIGLKTAGLPELPVIGHGHLSWLAAQEGLDSQIYLKPSPAHVLAALRLSLQAQEYAASPKSAVLNALVAARSALDGTNDGEWSRLEGAEISVFEDTMRGLLSARRAEGILNQFGIYPRLRLFGITGSTSKKQTLENLGAQVFSSLSESLRTLRILP